MTSGEGEYSLNIVRFKNLSISIIQNNHFSGQLSTSFETKTSIMLRSDLILNFIQVSRIRILLQPRRVDLALVLALVLALDRVLVSTSVTTQTSSPSVTQLTAWCVLGSLSSKRPVFRSPLSTNGIWKKNHDTLQDQYLTMQFLMITMVMRVYYWVRCLHRCFHGIPCRIVFSRQERKYSTLPAYDLVGNLISAKRNDTRTVFSAQLTKDLNLWAYLSMLHTTISSMLPTTHSMTIKITLLQWYVGTI